MLEPLTPREQEVCSYLLLGWPTQRIAEHLGISPRTCETHRRIVLAKWGARNAVDLIRKVYALGNRRGSHEDAFMPPWRSS